MKIRTNQNDGFIQFSLGHFLETSSFHNLFDNIKRSLQNEQKEIILGRKPKNETDSYFNFIKFLSSSPDKIS